MSRFHTAASNAPGVAVIVAVCGLLAASRPAIGAGEWAYRIMPGDTLIGVARAYLTEPSNWQRLQAFNGVKNPMRLQPGQNLRIPLAWLDRGTAVAQVVYVNGDASLSTLGDDAGTSRPLAIGDTLHIRDAVRTGAESSVTLRFEDGSRVLVAPGSQLDVLQLRRRKPGDPATRLQLDHGSAENHVTPSTAPRIFEIITPAINLGVRGTEFRAHVDADGGATRLEVLGGKVAAGSASSAPLVGPGFGLVAHAGQPPDAVQTLIAPPDLSALPKRVERIPLRFTWPAEPGAAKYRAQVLAADDALQLLLDASITEPTARWADLPDGRYSLRVRGIAASGLEGRDATIDFVLKARPEPPFTVEPARGSVRYGDTGKFKWTGTSAAKRYRLQVSNTTDFAAPVVDLTDLSGTEASAPLEVGSYFWRVASIGVTPSGADDLGPFGDIQAFTQRAVPPSPALREPQASDQGVLLQWQTPQAGQRIHFQIATNPAFTTPLKDDTTAESSTLLEHPAAGTYFMRARTIDADGFEGNYGATQTIDVPGSRLWWLLVPVGLGLLLTL